jgi:enoyl-CoA hydratase/carnithine racemase
MMTSTPTGRRLIAAGIIRRTPEPSDLAVAVELARRVLVGDNPVAVREALRILLRAVEQDAVRRSVDTQFPAIAAFLAEDGERR